MTAGPGHRLTLLGKPGCHLCDDARVVLQRLSAELSVPLDEVDITTDERLALDYGERIPVILVDGREHGYWRVEEARLRAALAR